MSKLQKWPAYTLGVGFLLPVVMVGIYLYLVVDSSPVGSKSVDATNNQLAVAQKKESTEVFSTTTAWTKIYPNTKIMKIDEKDVNVSIAKTWSERIKGLSNTPYLPENVVKLFVFESSGLHSFWMKDMRYPIDIIWLNEAEEIVYIKENATPESYPASFEPIVEALYVMETVSGFVETYSLSVGDKLDLPELDD
jgi:uncharacterized protein